MSTFGVLYEIKQGPSHTPDAEYAKNALREYHSILSNDPDEASLQGFLEKHPILVPGHATPGSSCGGSPLHCALITQPELPGTPAYRPDFMWITMHSMAWFPTLVEIERPNKRFFKRDAEPTANFSQARHQLALWRAWFNDPSNVQQFVRRYGIPDNMRKRTMQPRMILVYGRRQEFEGDAKLTASMNYLLPLPDELMTFDRLSVDLSMRDAITIRSAGLAKYEAVWIPEIFETGPETADRLRHIGGTSEAVSKNPGISEDRKAFLNRRIAYWKDWAASDGPRVYDSGDRE